MSVSPNCGSPSANPRLVGDPVDTLTGAVFDRKLEFRLTGPLELWWYRHYDSSQSHRPLALGWGQTHDFDRRLRFEGDAMVYEAPVGRAYLFPPLSGDGDQSALHGFVLRRVSLRRYELFHHGEPGTEFDFLSPEQPARPTRLLQGPNEILFRYGAADRLETIIDSAGREIAVVEEAGGRLRSLTLVGRRGQPDRLLLACRYDGRGNLVATENGSGHGYAFAYDDANRMVLRRGRKGSRFQFTYDGQGRCVRSEGKEGLHAVALDYRVPGRVTKVTRGDGGVWTYVFDRMGNLTQISDPLGGIEKFVRDEAGRVLLEVDPNGNATRVVYDAAGESVAKITPLGYRVVLPADPNAHGPFFHRVAADPAEYEFGRLLRRESITPPTACAVKDLPFAHEVRQLVTYRPEDAPTPLTGDGFHVRPLGLKWWPKPVRGRIFSELGKLVRQEDDCGRLREWTYDASGNLAQHTDFDGGQWAYEYGSWHFLLGQTDPLGGTVKLSYTSEGELASCTDAGGTRSDYAYDLNDHLVEVRRHGAVRDRYTVDAAGNLLAKHAGDGRLLLTFEIGPGNLPVKCTLASGDEHTFEYDDSGRPRLLATRKDAVAISYDALGNRCAEKRNGQGVEHFFHAYRTPAESTHFGRFVIRYRRPDVRTLIMTDPGGKRHQLRFHPHGLVERRFSNGSRETAQYDALGRCLFKSSQRAVGPVWNRRYCWSGEGELRRVQDSLHGETRHEYDAAHRLRRRVTAERVEDFAMDAAGNLLSQPALEGVTLREGNRLKTVNGLEVGYNDRNHLAERQTPGGASVYRYDSRDQLVTVETPHGRWEAEYDALGRRTRKTWAGMTTEFYWCSDQLSAEVFSDGRLRLYVYADPLALTPIIFLDYDSVEAPPEACRRYFVFSDQIGTPCLIEDEAGREVWRARVEPFGRAQVAPASTIECNLRFPGHYFDPELALHYNRCRHYDPGLGRYLQSDPWGIPGGYNLYAYRSNPLLQVDARGLGEGNDDDETPNGNKEGTKKVPTDSDDEPWDAAAAARDRAAELRETEDNPPTATSCAVNRATNTPYFGDSNEDPGEIHPALQQRINELGSSQEEWAITNCAEFNSVNKALWDGADYDDLDVHTVDVQTGADKARCKNCQHTTAGTHTTSD